MIERSTWSRIAAALGVTTVLTFSSSSFADESAESGAVTPPTTTPTETSGSAADSLSAQVADQEKTLEEQGKIIKEQADTNKKLEGEIADVKALASGTLLEKAGVTGGVALMTQIPLLFTGDDRLSSTQVNATPYIMFVPAFWGAAERQNAFCARRYLGDSPGKARAAAVSISHDEATSEIEHLIVTIQSAYENKKAAGQTGTAAEDIVDNDFIDTHSLAGTEVTVAREIATAVIGGRTITDSLKTGWTYRFAEQTWKPQLNAKCGWYKVGAYVGIPLTYTASVSLGESGQSGQSVGNREVVPKISFGLAYVLNSWAHLMGGLTYATVATGQIADVGTSGDSKPIWTFDLAVGGAVDFFTMLSKAKL